GVAAFLGDALDAAGEELPEHRRLRRQLLVVERRQRRLERVDRLDRLRVLLQQPVVAAAENQLQPTGNHREQTVGTCKSSQSTTGVGPPRLRGELPGRGL